MFFLFLQNGDSAITIQFEKKISKKINAYVTSLSNSLEKKEINGIVDVIPAFCSLTVVFDSSIINEKKIKRIIKKELKNISDNNFDKKRIFVIPVCYDDEFALDIINVSNYTGLSKEDIISIHSGTDYLIYMLGFLPGFAYLGGLDKRIITPRLKSPRTIIPTGSVGIGGEQTGIYPLESPGGWQLIGRTPIKPYDPYRKDEILYSTGDYIRFKRVTKNEYQKIEKEVNIGAYQVEVILEESK